MCSQVNQVNQSLVFMTYLLCYSVFVRTGGAVVVTAVVEDLTRCVTRAARVDGVRRLAATIPAGGAREGGRVYYYKNWRFSGGGSGVTL